MSEKILMELLEGQGVWAACFLFLLIYTIRETGKREDRAWEREECLKNLLSDLSKNYVEMCGHLENIKDKIR